VQTLNRRDRDKNLNQSLGSAAQIVSVNAAMNLNLSPMIRGNQGPRLAPVSGLSAFDRTRDDPTEQKAASDMKLRRGLRHILMTSNIW
jgi:hypothetical protein